MPNLTASMPVYVTHKIANGATAFINVPAWLFFSFGLALVLNVALWLGIGIYEAIRFII